jgi:hypothetical protein
MIAQYLFVKSLKEEDFKAKATKRLGLSFILFLFLSGCLCLDLFVRVSLSMCLLLCLCLFLIIGFFPFLLIGQIEAQLKEWGCTGSTTCRTNFADFALFDIVEKLNGQKVDTSSFSHILAIHKAVGERTNVAAYMKNNRGLPKQG